MHACAARRRTKRWEAHIWDDKKQVYLGGFDIEEHAGEQPLPCCVHMLCLLQHSIMAPVYRMVVMMMHDLVLQWDHGLLDRGNHLQHCISVLLQNIRSTGAGLQSLQLFPPPWLEHCDSVSQEASMPTRAP
jgi:hypothetical protein